MIECVANDWKNSIPVLGILLLEAWLGKTDKTRYGSTLEMIVMGTVSLLKKKR
jgi:hypothetical protein